MQLVFDEALNLLDLRMQGSSCTVQRANAALGTQEFDNQV